MPDEWSFRILSPNQDCEPFTNRPEKSPPTRASLVLRLRDSHDQVAWGEFVELYAPLIHAYGLHQGLQDADAADLAQDVLQAVAAHAGRFDYDPRKGSFRGWLFTITRNKLRNSLARQRGKAQAQGGTDMHKLMNAVADDEVSDEFWIREHQRRLFHWAASRIRQDFQAASWEAFWKTAIEEQPAANVARALNISVGAVYIARSRILARLREEIASVENADQ